jgi:hypothetical protein
MIRRFARMALLLLGLVARPTLKQALYRGAEGRQLATPERAGWSATRLAEMRGYVEEMGSTSAMIVQHGVGGCRMGRHRAQVQSALLPQELIERRGSDAPGTFWYYNTGTVQTDRCQRIGQRPARTVFRFRVRRL